MALLIGLWPAGRGVCAVKQSNAASPAKLKCFGTMGKGERILESGRESELFEHDGRGCLTHMWFGGAWPNYGKTRIRIYVDGESTASIDMELMMGHGIGFQDSAAPWGTARIGKTGQPSGIYDTYRIPFGQSIRVTAELSPGEKEKPAFWWIIRGVENLPVQIGPVTLPAKARLKLYKKVNYTAKRLEEFSLLDTHNAGLLYQVTIAARSENFCFLEACMRAYIDGAEKPLWLSSGLEDYFVGTYYFNRGCYHTPIAGLTHKNDRDHSFSAYRFHEDDPILFEKGLRLTCRCGEEINGQVYGDPRDTTYTTYAWVYEW
jgi:hypothetical protein